MIRHMKGHEPGPFSLAVAERLGSDPDIEVVDLELGDWPEWEELSAEVRRERDRAAVRGDGDQRGEGADDAFPRVGQCHAVLETDSSGLYRREKGLDSHHVIIAGRPVVAHSRLRHRERDPLLVPEEATV